jgi:hypothetical protein
MLCEYFPLPMVENKGSDVEKDWQRADNIEDDF